MTIYKVTVNKQNMVQLLRYMGYTPTLKRAKFMQKVSPRSWELTWKEPAGAYKAVLEVAGGRVGLRIEHAGGHRWKIIGPAVLAKYGMVRNMVPEGIAQ